MSEIRPSQNISALPPFLITVRCQWRQNSVNIWLPPLDSSVMETVFILQSPTHQLGAILGQTLYEVKLFSLIFISYQLHR